MLLYWLIALIWAIIGTIVFWIILSVKWSRIDPIYKRMFETFRVFHPIPGFPGYLDLKFSILRHAAVFLVCAILIFYVKVKWILNVVLFLNILYAWLPILRYKARKRDVVETAMRPEGKATASIIAIPIRDSSCTIVFSVICTILLYGLFAIRP